MLHFGDHNLNCGVREFRGDEAYYEMVSEMMDIFSRADLPETIRALDRHFGASIYSIKSLFYDERRKVLDMIMASTFAEAEGLYRQIYTQQAPLMRFLTSLDGIPLPRYFLNAADFLLNAMLLKAFVQEDFDAICHLLKEAKLWQVELDAVGLGFALQQTMVRLAEIFHFHPGNLAALEQLEAAAGLAVALPFPVYFRRVQNIFFAMLQSPYPEWRQRADQGEEDAQRWIRYFHSLGEKLAVCVESSAL